MYGPCNFAAAEEHGVRLDHITCSIAPLYLLRFQTPEGLFIVISSCFFCVFLAWWAREQ